MIARTALQWAWFEATIRGIQEKLEAREIGCNEAKAQQSNAALLAVFGTFIVRGADGHEQVI